MIKQRKQSSDSTKPPEEPSGNDEDTGFKAGAKRRINLYDAVAGRATQAGLIGNVKDVKASKQPLRPDEVLFKRANAPTRYEETDYYSAHAKLPADRQLPNGDLLTALHAYVSKLYFRTREPGSQKAWRCMDETALIAFGILMEETARGVMGETGDLAFTEAADEEEERALVGEGKDEMEEDNEEENRSASGNTKSKDNDSDTWFSSGDDSRYTTEESD